MRVSELSRVTGTPIPTIKYYIREGLVPRGRSTAPNQAEYGEEHAERLRLVRILREVASLSVATIRQVVEALEEPEATARAEHVTTALKALSPDPGPISDTAVSMVDSLLARTGWEVDADSAGYRNLAAALTSLEEIWQGDVSLEGLEGYARIADQLAAMEIPDDWDPGQGGGDALTYAVLGTVLYEPVILAMRRLAHAARHRRLMAERS